MQNDDKDDGYSEEEEDVSCLTYLVGSHGVERMTIRLLAECADAAHVPTRQSAARQILEALQLAVTSVEAYSEQEDVEKVFAYINKLSQDSETIVRCSLLNTLPKVASFCAEYDSPLVSLKELIETDILPIVLKAIADEDEYCNMRVRKEGYNVLRYLLNNNLLTQKSIENKISDLCTNLLFHPNDIINLITAGNFIARMPPVVGEATTEKLLLPKISDLCTNQYAKVREACVHYLIDLACHVNPLVTENIIIPLFIKLSEDGAWCVRKACVETIVMLSCMCLMETRKTVLTRVFLNLLPDLEIPVLSVAYKQLGPFMTSFAQPSLIALGSNRNGDYLLIHSQSGSTFELMSRRSLTQFYEQPEQSNFPMIMLPMKTMDNSVNLEASNINNEKQTNVEMDTNNSEPSACYTNDIGNSIIEENAENTNYSGANIEALLKRDNLIKDDDINSEKYFKKFFAEEYWNDMKTVNANDEHQFKSSPDDALLNNQYKNQPDLVQSCLKINWRRKEISTTSDCSAEADRFNSFQFWREPIPEFDERDLPTARKIESDNIHVHIPRNGFETRDCNYERDMNDCHTRVLAEYPAVSRTKSVIKVKEQLDPCDWKNEGTIVKGVKNMLCVNANVTPKQNVLPQALLDAFNEMVLTVTFDVKMHCAYTFPAVVLTLGSANWHLLKHTYAKLATDSERQIRQVIASSIHEIASILGPELATEDLIPIYNSLINDMEDIRITALNHLSCFVKLLKSHGRCQFLPHLMEYMMTDYVWNWRFRQQLSEQLIEMIDFFSPDDCWKYVSPVAFTLLMDRVSAVRLQALHLITHLIRVVSVDVAILRGILAELAEQFAHSTQWTRRQSFAFLCSSLLRTPVLPDDMFARDVLPHLLDLSWDSIPNVRIAVARTLSCDVITYPYFSNVFRPHYDVLTQVLKRLYKDKDRDVRYFASLNTSTLTPLATYEGS